MTTPNMTPYQVYYHQVMTAEQREAHRLRATRSQRRLQQQAQRRGTPPRTGPWEDWEDGYLAQHRWSPLCEVAQALNRTYYAVVARRNILGLSVPRTPNRIRSRELVAER